MGVTSFRVGVADDSHVVGRAVPLCADPNSSRHSLVVMIKVQDILLCIEIETEAPPKRRRVGEKSISYLEGSQDLPARPAGESSSMRMKVDGKESLSL